MGSKLRWGKKSGFTLIELLVVIAIIGILAAIIIASVSRVRAEARDAKRIAALRTVDTAMGLWLSNKFYIPDAAGNKVVSPAPDADDLVVDCNSTADFGFGQNKCLAMKSNAVNFIGAPGSAFSTNGVLTTKITDPNDPACFILYVTNGVDYETMTPLESDSQKMQNDGGNEPLAYERGSRTDLAGTWASMSVTPCSGAGGGGSPPPPPPPPPPPSLPSGLVAAYNFNGNANDSSGNGNNGAVFGGASYGSGPSAGYGQALSFDGVDDYVSAGAGVPIPGTGPGTWTAWINRNDVANRDVGIIGKGDDNSDEGWVVAIRNGADQVGFDGVYSNGNSRRYTPQPPNGTWYHLAITWNSTGSYPDPATNVVVYVNGSPVGSYFNTQDAGSGGTGHLSDVAHPLYIGDSEWRTSPNLNKFKGALDNVRIYNRVLAPSEITDDMNYQN